MKFKISMKKVPKKIIFKCLFIDDSLRERGKIYEKNGFSISSEQYTELTTFIIYLNGSARRRDGQLVTRLFSNDNERDKYYFKIKEIIDSYREKCANEIQTPV